MAGPRAFVELPQFHAVSLHLLLLTFLRPHISVKYLTKAILARLLHEKFLKRVGGNSMTPSAH